MLQTYGIFYVDTQQCLGTYVASTPNYSDWTAGDRPVIHAIVPPYVSPTNCKLMSIIGVWYAVNVVEAAIANAVAFGMHLTIKFAADNVMLGVTQAGMTTTVRTVMAPAIQCLQTGSLYDAIAQCRAVPGGSKDATFITDARLLAFINLVEDYLGIVRSTSL
jgi:hypothetical protein